MIASDRVEGTPVRSTDGTRIGAIERVMIDKLTGSGPNLARIIRRPPEGFRFASTIHSALRNTEFCAGKWFSLAAHYCFVSNSRGRRKPKLCSPGDRQNFAMK